MKIKVYRFKAESYDKDGSVINNGVDTDKDIQEELDYFIDMHVRTLHNLEVSVVPILYPEGGTQAVYLYYTIIYTEKRD